MEKNLKEKLERAWQAPGEFVGEWKARTGGKAVGLLLTDAPEELVGAAGALPVTVMAREVAFSNVDQHLQGFACSYSRSAVELAMRGELDFLDGLIVPYACDTTRCLDLVFKYMGRFQFEDCCRLPKRVTADGVKTYFVAELKRLAHNLGQFTGQEVTAARLTESIRAYNRVRSLLAQLQEVSSQGGLSAMDYFSAVRAAMVMAPADSEPLLQAVVDSLAGAAAKKDGRLRIVLAGKIPTPPGIIGVIEDAGLQIVEDHLVVGGRWVASRPSESGDPWEALALRQLDRLPFAGIWDRRANRSTYLVERVRALSADGAVFLIQKFCELAELDYPGIRENLEKENIPALSLESDFQDSSLEPIRTRVQAFAEMLKAKK